MRVADVYRLLQHNSYFLRSSVQRWQLSQRMMVAIQGSSSEPTCDIMRAAVSDQSSIDSVWADLLGGDDVPAETSSDAASPEAPPVRPPLKTPAASSAASRPTKVAPPTRRRSAQTPPPAPEGLALPLPPPPRVSADSEPSVARLPPLRPLRATPPSPPPPRSARSTEAGLGEREMTSARIDLRPIDFGSALGNIESAPIDIIEEDAPRPAEAGSRPAKDIRFRDASTRPIAVPDGLAVTRPVPSHHESSLRREALAEDDRPSWSPPPPPTVNFDLLADDQPSTGAFDDVDVSHGKVPPHEGPHPGPTSALDDVDEMRPIDSASPGAFTPMGLNEADSVVDAPASTSRRWIPAVIGIAAIAAAAAVWLARSPDKDPTHALASAQAGLAPTRSSSEPSGVGPSSPSQPADRDGIASNTPDSPDIAVRAAATPSAAAGSIASETGSAEKSPPAPEEPADEDGIVAPAAVEPTDDDDHANEGDDTAPELQAAYDRALETYRATRSREALAEMTTLACEMQDHATAYNAFRKLKGKELRSEAVVRCRNVDIDVRSSVPRSTAQELIARAETALAQGHAERAYKMALGSNRRKRTSEAILLMGRAACALGNSAEARTLTRHLNAEESGQLADECRSAGIEL